MTIKEHPKEVVTYNIQLTPRQLYKLTVLLGYIPYWDGDIGDGMHTLIKHEPSNVDFDKLVFECNDFCNSFYFKDITDEEVARMWDEEEHGT